jgi:hypothetical protein
MPSGRIVGLPAILLPRWFLEIHWVLSSGWARNADAPVWPAIRRLMTEPGALASPSRAGDLPGLRVSLSSRAFNDGLPHLEILNPPQAAQCCRQALSAAR